MRTNYSTATSARPEKSKSSGNGNLSRGSASNKRKPSVVDRDFSGSDEWPTHEAEPTVVVTTSTPSDTDGHETDSSHQGYFAEWINEAEASAVQARAESSADQLVGSEPAVAEFEERTSTWTKSEPTIQEKAIQRLASVSGPVPKIEKPVAKDQEPVVSVLADLAPTDGLLSEPAGIEELARSTGGYEALAPEQLAIEEAATLAFDNEVLAHDPNYSASLEQIDLKETSRSKNRDLLTGKIGAKGKSSKNLDSFHRPELDRPKLVRPELSVQDQAVRTVDNPHLLVGDYVAPPHIPNGADGNPMRKAAVLGLVAVVAVAAIGVSVQRNRAAEPEFDVTSFAERAPSDSPVGQEVLNNDVEEPALTTTTVAPTTTADPGPDLEARKQMQAATAEAPTTTAAPTTTEQATVSIAPATTVDESAGVESETETPAVTDEESTSTTAAENTDAAAVDEETESATETTAVDSSTETTVADETATAADSSTTETTSEQPSTTTAEATTTTASTSTEEGWVDAGNGVALPAVMLDIRYCESRGDYQAANGTSSARGAYQFLTGSWDYYGHAARYGVSFAHLASPAQQDEAALKTWEVDGTRPWNASKSCWSKNPVA